MSRNEAFAPWQCPLCGGALQGENDLKCEKGHCFDRAREGYWHLLPVQSMRTKAPGDSKEMVAARRAFLNAGYYGIFGQALGELCLAHGVPAAKDAPLHLLDAGCGEGWYDRCIAQQFAAAEKPLQLAGFDIAKPAVRLAAKALPAAQYAVASSFSQPVRTGWADVLLNCFSPFAQEEFSRVLRPGGRMIYVVPGAEHLYQMKAVLYEKPYKNPVQQVEYPGFRAIDEREVQGTITVPAAQLEAPGAHRQQQPGAEEQPQPHWPPHDAVYGLDSPHEPLWHPIPPFLPYPMQQPYSSCGAEGFSGAGAGRGSSVSQKSSCSSRSFLLGFSV